MIQTFKSIAEGAGYGSMWAPPEPKERGDDPSQQPGTSIENPNTPFDRIFNTAPSYSGKSVSEITALQLAAVWRCTWLISGAIARTPFLPYTRDDKGKILARTHYLWPVLTRRANRLMTAYRWKRLMQMRACLWGNAYSLVLQNQRGQITELWPLRSDKMRPHPTFNSNGTLKDISYVYTTQNGNVSTFLEEEILHIRGLESDGVTGLSPIAANRQSIGLSMSAEEYGARFFGKGFHPGGWVGTSGKLNPESRKNVQNSLNDLYGGLEGAHKLAVLEEGLTYHSMAIPPEDIQFLQTRQFQAIDIARLFGVPPHMIAELSRATFSNIEQQSIEFVGTCLDDWFVNWESECMAQLLSDREAQTIELDFFEQKLLRGDMESRFKVYSIGRQNTILNPNDCREMEGLNRIDEDWANDYMQPLNMVVAGEDVPDSEDPDVIDDPQDAGPKVDAYGNPVDEEDDNPDEGDDEEDNNPPPAAKNKQQKSSKRKELAYAGNRPALNGYHR